MSDADAALHDPNGLMSALVDGETGAGDCARGCAAWAEEGSAARRRWHAYHLIGDVLRSEDLACHPGHDVAFLQRLSQRLAQEPQTQPPATPEAEPPAAPEHAQARPVALRARWGWAVPMALAASVAALAVSLLLVRGFDQPPAGTLLAGAATGGPVGLAPAPAEPRAAAGQLIRDARLDRYLRAHREYGAVQPASLPGGSVRRVETVSFER